LKQNNPNNSVDFLSQDLIFTLFLNFSDLCGGEVEGPRLIFLFFFPQIKEMERRQQEKNVNFQVSLHIL